MEINWLAIVLAIVVGMAVAGVWYSKLAFGIVSGWRSCSTMPSS